VKDGDENLIMTISLAVFRLCMSNNIKFYAYELKAIFE